MHRKRTLEIDDKELEGAARALNTTGVKNTVNEALRMAAGKERLEALIESSINHTHVDSDYLEKVREVAWR